MRILTALDSTPPLTMFGLRRVSLVVCEGCIVGAWRWSRYFADWRAAKIMLPLVAAKGVVEGEAEEMERLLYPLIYRWRNNEVRARLYGRRCRIVARGALNTVMLEFGDNLERITTSGNAVRKAKEGD